MANVRTLKKSFNGGEISRELLGMVDLTQVQSGLDTCRNFIVQPQGSVRNRPGTTFTNEVKNSNLPTRLISFSFSQSQTYAIELGERYFRFHTLAATLIDDATGLPYEVSNFYNQADLFDIHYVQSGDIITLVHPNYPPAELRRYSALNWTFSSISFVSNTPAPTGVTAAATYATAGVTKTFKYVITALNALGYEESQASAVSNTVSNDLTITGNFNTITWAAVDGAIRYNVYKYSGGTYGYIGQVAALSFVDDNIIAGLTKTIPIVDSVFDSGGNYPAAVCYYEQRRFFGGTNNQPQNVWSTQSASETNMAYSIPSQASDALRFKIAAQRANTIRHMVPVYDMLVFTASTEWRVYSSSGDALSPTSLTIKPQSQNGAANVQPQIANNNALYVQAQGGHVREMSYDWKNSGYQNNDLCYLASHLFDEAIIVDMAFSRAPTPILWVVNDSGALLGMTYDPYQQIAAWHKHDTVNGVIESICTVTENNADVLYMVVRRTIDGVSKRYIEAMHSRAFNGVLEEAFFVDCGLTYRGPSATVISGLSHLENETVTILADGAVVENQIVKSGQVTLPSPASVVHVGLPITADIITTPPLIQNDITLGQSRTENIKKAWVRVFKSGEFFVGPDADDLTPIKMREWEPYGSPPGLTSNQRSIVVTSLIGDDGRLMIRQTNPLPVTIVSIVAEVSIGG